MNTSSLNFKQSLVRPDIAYKFLKASIHHVGISYVLVEGLCQIESFSLGLGFIQFEASGEFHSLLP